MTPAEKLCLACGLCCDGTLFGHVKLGLRDDAAKLKTLGMPVAVTRAKPPVTHFLQPCAALCADRTCRIYAHRPTQCRSFECGVFKDAAAGRLSPAAALRQVRHARRLAKAIRRLLSALGETDEHRSLDERFHLLRDRMETAAGTPAAADQFAKLSVAMHAFTLLTHEKFYTRTDKAPLRLKRPT